MFFNLSMKANEKKSCNSYQFCGNLFLFTVSAKEAASYGSCGYRGFFSESKLELS